MTVLERLAFRKFVPQAEREAERSSRLAADAATAEILRQTAEALKTALAAERELRAAESALRNELLHRAPVRPPWWRVALGL